MQDFLRDLTVSHFLVEIFWALVISGFFRVILFVFKNTQIRERWYWIAMPLLFLIAELAFHAVFAGHADIRPTVEVFSIGATDGTGSLAPTQSMLVVMAIRNVGMPTVVGGFHLSVRWNNGDSSDIPPLAPLSISFPATPPVVFRPEDSMLVKTLSPIPTGGMVRGVLVYPLPQGRTAQDLQASEATIAVIDIFEKAKHAKITFKNIGMPLPSFPGLGETH